MIKLTVLYGQPTDREAFEAYYIKTHLPLVAQMKGVRRAELTLFTAPEGAVPEYYRMAELYFDSQEHLETVISSKEGQLAVADIDNFASGGATVLIGQVA